MPDTRTHRGAHADDVTLFSPAALPALQSATSELCWLLNRGYAVRSSLALVGDRHNLTQRQRIAVSRCACSDAQRISRRAREIEPSHLAGEDVWIDGYNLLITVEAAMAGGVILIGRDGCYRDMASLHGTYREVVETLTATQMIGNAFAEWNVRQCHWLLDKPVSNSGRLKTRLVETAAAAGWRWEVGLEFSPDHVLKASPGIVVSADSVVLDACDQWFNAGREIISRQIPSARVVDLSEI